MATSPVDYLSGLGGLKGLPNSYETMQGVHEDQQNNQMRDQRLQLGAQVLAQGQAEQQQQQEYQTAAAAALRDGSPAAISSLITRFPQQHAAIAKGWEIKDTGQKQADLRSAGEVLSALDAGRADLAIASMEARIAAEDAAGQDVSADRQQLAALKSGDPAAIKATQGALRYTLAAVEPDKFATTLGKVGGAKDGGYTLAQGNRRYDSDNNLVAEAPPAPDKGTIERVESLDADGNTVVSFVRVGAGAASTSSASSAPVSGRTQGGWTPRERNGGDNSDAAVDNKIKGVAELLGVDPDADVSTLSPLQIAKALAYGEGGKGSLADRNNNPTNIRNGDGSYKKFESPDKAYSAAAALVARKLRRGQTTVKTLIEGLPVGGGSPQPSGTPGALASFVTKPAGAGAANIVAGDLSTVPPSIRAAVKAVAEGRTAPPRAGSRNGEAMLDAVTAYDPTFDAANATSRVKTRVDFTSGKSAQAVNAMNTAMGHLIHLDDQAHDLGNSSFMPGVINPIYNAGRTRIGNNTSLGAFEQTKQAASSELRKVFAGAGGGNLEELKQFEANLDSSKSPEQLHTVIANAVELLGSRLNALEDQYTQGMGRSDQIPTMIKPSLARSAKQRFGIDLGSHGKAEAPASSGPPAGAKQIGTYQGKAVFQLPNGKRVVAQ